MSDQPIPEQARNLADRHRRRVGRRLGRARMMVGMSTHELARRTGGLLDASVITRCEQDGIVPSLPRQFALALALDVDPDQLWGFHSRESTFRRRPPR